ncbi:MAG: VOC family protein [Acidobacteria bacterium]|nr:VOC family protein [Acidobacteriota bacterium]MBI3657300.1 VOC family protein [Acidobacteriota bacterium]
MGNQKVGWPFWIGVTVTDLDAQRKFYREVVGLVELKSDEGWVWFDLGSSNIFELQFQEDLPEASSRGFRVGFNVENVAAARAELIDRGVQAIGEIEGNEDWGGYWCYFIDPEGNTFALTQKISA